ncbi:kti12, chromatin associated [Homalodisca vitripennis]|nr:kti12, chromatin associated [Homalodisca vitripennis]
MPLPVLPDTSATDELTRRFSSFADCEWNCCVYVVKLVFDILGRCVVCTRNGLRKETIYVCETCTARPNLHPDTCFKTYHTLLGRDNVVILDAANYIKGYRYELYCASKNSKTTQVTVECVVNTEQAWEWNLGLAKDQQYTREAFDALIMRYEAPDSRNRWDSPLITLQPEDPTPNEVLHDALFQRKPPPPNQSTQSAPLSSTNFLYELDRVTQEVVTSILSAQKLGICGEVKIPGFSDCVLSLPGSPLSPAQLARHRRQFLAYTRLNPPSSPQQSAHHLAHMFVQFLNTTLAGAN